jgi:hypothetical protein
MASGKRAEGLAQQHCCLFGQVLAEYAAYVVLSEHASVYIAHFM